MHQACISNQFLTIQMPGKCLPLIICSIPLRSSIPTVQASFLTFAHPVAPSLISSHLISRDHSCDISLQGEAAPPISQPQCPCRLVPTGCFAGSVLCRLHGLLISLLPARGEALRSSLHVCHFSQHLEWKTHPVSASEACGAVILQGMQFPGRGPCPHGYVSLPTASV